MSINKAALWAVATAWSLGAWADPMWPEHLAMPNGTLAPARTSAGPLAAPATLADLAAGTGAPAGPDHGLKQALGRWSPAAGQAGDGEGAAVAVDAAKDAFRSFVGLEVSMADYLGLAGLGPLAQPGAAQGPAPDTRRDRGTVATVPRWALPSILSDQLTRYLFVAAVVSIVAGALLRLARTTRQHSAASMMRL